VQGNALILNFSGSGPDEDQEKLAAAGVRAECVARIIVAKERLPAFVKAMRGVQEKLGLAPEGE
jgi:hypothetical protein